MIKVQNISKKFYQAQTCIQVLKNLNLDIANSETVAIVGPSGCGKTTLLSLLAGLESPDSGEIYINNENIVEMNERQLASFRSKNIGIVFQQFHLMPHLTALENVSLPLEILGEKEASKKALEELKKIKLDRRKDHLPHQMSGGECQRVAIARACVTQPKVIFADEPSGNLDSESAKMALDLLFSLVKENKMTLILVTHNKILAQRCDRQIYISSDNN